MTLRTDAPRDVRSQKNIREIIERRILRRRFWIRDIERGEQIRTPFEDRDHLCLVYHGATGRVDERRAGFHAGEMVFAQKPRGLPQQRRVATHDVRPGK